MSRSQRYEDLVEIEVKWRLSRIKRRSPERVILARRWMSFHPAGAFQSVNAPAGCYPFLSRALGSRNPL